MMRSQEMADEMASRIWMIPVSFCRVAGCTLVELEDHDLDESHIAELLKIRWQGDIAGLERATNRCYIVADLLDPLGIDHQALSPDNLRDAAFQLAARWRQCLAETFPDDAFNVAVEGGEGVEDEPLELNVTFHRQPVAQDCP